MKNEVCYPAQAVQSHSEVLICIKWTRDKVVRDHIVPVTHTNLTSM